MSPRPPRPSATIQAARIRELEKQIADHKELLAFIASVVQVPRAASYQGSSKMVEFQREVAITISAGLTGGLERPDWIRAWLEEAIGTPDYEVES